MRNISSRIEQLEHIIFKDIPDGLERQDIQFFDRLYKCYGSLRSTAKFSDPFRIASEVYFHHREKAEIALTAGSSWYGGDYFEFGSHDLNTFRNMLSAYDICGMTKQYQDVRFYAFDIFGDPAVNAPKSGTEVIDKDFITCFSHYMTAGDQMELHYQYIEQHNLYLDKCFLVQGLFENTLNDAFKAKYKSENRKIGFAFLDCNMGASYKTVFEYIFDMMAENSYIYMDEYFQSSVTLKYYQQFVNELREKRNIGSVYIRNAGGFGGLFRLYPLGSEEDVPLDLKIR